VREHGAAPVPAWLRSGPLAQERSHEDQGPLAPRPDEYDNPHRHPGHLGRQRVAPDAVAGERFYRPDDAEREFDERLQRIRRERDRDT
jgi:replication-associated recombination protein RarA